MSKAKVGIYYDVPFAEYKEIDAVNNSLLWILKTKSPLHAKTYMDNPPLPTDAFHLGGAFHILLLEPRKFNRFYAVMPVCDRRTKKGKEIYAAFTESVNSKELLANAEFEQIDTMVDAIKKQVLYRLVQEGKPEIVVVWKEKKTGILCKARLDYIHPERAIIIDVKSTVDASPGRFPASCYRYGYYQQAAFYCDGYKAVTGDDPAFTFLPVEKSEPFAVAAYEAHEQMIFAGRHSYQQALDIWAECAKTNHWPGYESKVEIINLPPWALTAEGIGPHQVFE